MATRWFNFDVKTYLRQCLFSAGLSYLLPVVDNAVFESFGVNGKCVLGSPFKMIGNHDQCWADYQASGKPRATLLNGMYFGIYMFYWSQGEFFLKIGQAGPKNDKRWGWSGRKPDGHYVLSVSQPGKLPGSTLAKFLWSQIEPNPPFQFSGDEAKIQKLTANLPSSGLTNKWTLKQLANPRLFTTKILNSLSDYYGNWIKSHCERYDILFPLAEISNELVSQRIDLAFQKEISDFLESALQLYFRPLFEQNCFNH
jgi:hypothetical protein